MVLPLPLIRLFDRIVLILFHFGITVMCLATPVYVAGIRAASRAGIELAWYHRAGLVVASLLIGFILMVTPGLIALSLRSAIRSCRRLAGR